MKVLRRMLISALIVGLALVGCAPGNQMGGDSMSGIGDPVDRETALEMARRDSPLAVVESEDITASLPITHVFIGKDKDGRPVAVWVRRAVEFTYLENTLSRSQAVAVATQHGVPAPRYSVLTRVGWPDHSLVWHVGDEKHSVYVDAFTGEIARE